MENQKIIWQTPAHEHRIKGHDWFWGVGIIAFSIVGTSIILGDILFAIIIIISAIIIVLSANKEPKLTEVSIDSRGIRINDLHYPYSTLDGFCIDENFGLPKLLVKSKKTFATLIIAPIGDDVDIEKVQKYLSIFIKEEELQEPLSHKIVDFLGL